MLQAVISGSHRPDFRRPVFSRADGTAKPPWPDDFGTEVVTVQPGDALIFSEKLLHSTAMYTGSGQRRTLFCARPPSPALTDWLRDEHSNSTTRTGRHITNIRYSSSLFSPIGCLSQHAYLISPNPPNFPQKNPSFPPVTLPPESALTILCSLSSR